MVEPPVPVAELAYAVALKAIGEIHVGSNPTRDTTLFNKISGLGVIKMGRTRFGEDEQSSFERPYV